MVRWDMLPSVFSPRGRCLADTQALQDPWGAFRIPKGKAVYYPGLRLYDFLGGQCKEQTLTSRIQHASTLLVGIRIICEIAVHWPTTGIL